MYNLRSKKQLIAVAPPNATVSDTDDSDDDIPEKQRFDGFNDDKENNILQDNEWLIGELNDLNDGEKNFQTNSECEKVKKKASKREKNLLLG